MLAATPNKPTYNVEAQKGDVATVNAADSNSYFNNNNNGNSGNDRYSPLTANHYVCHWLSVAMHERVERVNNMAVRNCCFHTALKSVTIGSSAFAALSLQWAISNMLTVTAALGATRTLVAIPPASWQ